MSYTQLYRLLKSKIDYLQDEIILDDKTKVYNLEFISSGNVLPGDETCYCKEHDITFKAEDNFRTDIGEGARLIDIRDAHIIENKRFIIQIFTPVNKVSSNKAILLFHGFNEKSWEKYYPWAKRLSEITGKAVILFPMAFHMNRAPHLWSSKYEMFELSKIRKGMFPDVRHSTLSNVAISSRLHTRPQRFIWSGLQSYNDVIAFMESVKENKIPFLAPDTRFDIFAYSIGAFLSQILMMTNTKGYFDNTKLCMFCGGAVFNRLSPVSKFIIDSKANVALYSYLIEHFESHMKQNARLKHYMEKHPEGMHLSTMLNYGKNRPYRESLFRKMSDRMMAITLENDQIIPYYEIINTLKGVTRDIPVSVEVKDYPYPYTHENPFPVGSKYEDEVTRNFEQTIGEAAHFLNT